MIEFSCKNCGSKLNVEDKHSGKRVKCPKCGDVGVVPDKSDKIRFHCENCGQSIRVPQSYAGKKGRCPKCQNPVVVPSLEKPPPESTETFSIVCSMCEETMQVPETSRGQTIECPGCGSYVETSPGGVVDGSEASVPSGADEDPYQEETEEEYEESEGVDRRLIVVISGVAAVVIVGLVILVAVLRPSRPQQEVADTAESPTELQLDQVREFVEQRIGLLENGEIDETLQSLTPGLADDANRPQVEKLSQQIGESRIIEMDCTRTHRVQRPEGDQVLLWYNLRCEEGTQAVIVSVLATEQEFTIEGIAAKARFGREVSIGARGFAQLSRVGTTVGSERTRTPRGQSRVGTTVRSERSRAPRGQLISALAVRFAIGTFISAFCLWAGMKITRVEGTFVAMLGIAAISSLASTIPVLLAPIGFMPCFGWLIGQIVMFVLICKWTDAEFWPDAVGMVLVAGLVGMFLSMFLSQFMAMA